MPWVVSSQNANQIGKRQHSYEKYSFGWQLRCKTVVGRHWFYLYSPLPMLPHHFPTTSLLFSIEIPRSPLPHFPSLASSRPDASLSLVKVFTPHGLDNFFVRGPFFARLGQGLDACFCNEIYMTLARTAS